MSWPCSGCAEKRGGSPMPHVHHPSQTLAASLVGIRWAGNVLLLAYLFIYFSGCCWFHGVPVQTPVSTTEIFGLFSVTHQQVLPRRFKTLPPCLVFCDPGSRADSVLSPASSLSSLITDLWPLTFLNGWWWEERYTWTSHVVLPISQRDQKVHCCSVSCHLGCSLSSCKKRKHQLCLHLKAVLRVHCKGWCCSHLWLSASIYTWVALAPNTVERCNT